MIGPSSCLSFTVHMFMKHPVLLAVLLVVGLSAYELPIVQRLYLRGAMELASANTPVTTPEKKMRENSAQYLLASALAKDNKKTYQELLAQINAVEAAYRDNTGSSEEQEPVIELALAGGVKQSPLAQAMAEDNIRVYLELLGKIGQSDPRYREIPAPNHEQELVIELANYMASKQKGVNAPVRAEFSPALNEGKMPILGRITKSTYRDIRRLGLVKPCDSWEALSASPEKMKRFKAAYYSYLVRHFGSQELAEVAYHKNIARTFRQNAWRNGR